jgi:hypothetical protein
MRLTVKGLMDRAKLYGLKLEVLKTDHKKYRLESPVCYAHMVYLSQVSAEIEFYALNGKFRTQRSLCEM